MDNLNRKLNKILANMEADITFARSLEVLIANRTEATGRHAIRGLYHQKLYQKLIDEISGK